ncbi:MAG TPA: hypothetical protein VHF89_04510, partial [Solirubrobacteraceae bacterium]|nr:hypothetical protein [Solirubrobacteraceae bacterium]
AEARRTSALADFVAEHGESGLRALGGRRAALRFLAEQDGGLDVATLVERLERRAEGAPPQERPGGAEGVPPQEPTGGAEGAR